MMRSGLRSAIAADLRQGPAHGLGATIEADSSKQKMAETDGGYEIEQPSFGA